MDIGLQGIEYCRHSDESRNPVAFSSLSFEGRELERWWSGEVSTVLFRFVSDPISFA
jgi:hypothetical protein